MSMTARRIRRWWKGHVAWRLMPTPDGVKSAHSQYMLLREQAAKAGGLCMNCRRVAPMPGRRECEPCRDRRLATDRARREQLTAAGICYMCKGPRDGPEQKCSTCRTESTQSTRERRARAHAALREARKRQREAERECEATQGDGQ